MRLYKADIHLEGDRNHVVVKSNLLAPELTVLMTIHGSISVQSVRQVDEKSMSPDEVRDRLMARYGRSRVGDGDDRRPVLRVAFPTWPQGDLPLDAKKAGVPESQMYGSSPAEKTAAAKMEAELREKWEAEREAERQEFAEREEALQLERVQLDEERAALAATEDGAKPLTDMQKLRAQAESLKATEDQLKSANSKDKLRKLIVTLQDEGQAASTGEDDGNFME